MDINEYSSKVVTIIIVINYVAKMYLYFIKTSFFMNSLSVALWT